MGIFDDLASATGNLASNHELVSRSLKTPALLHSLAEGLRTGSVTAKVDCAKIMVAVGRIKPDLLRPFAGDFFDAARGKERAVVKAAFEGLILLAEIQPSEVFAERDYLFEVARRADAQGERAATVLAILCKNSSNYRGKLVAPLARLLTGIRERDLARWLKTLAPAFKGSLEAKKRLTRELAERLPQLAEPTKTKVEKVLRAIERG